MSRDLTVEEILAPGTPFVTALRRFAELRPDEVVLIDQDGTITRRDLETRTNRLARAYAGLGVREGDFVTIGLPNSIRFVEAMVATWKLGATPQPVSHRLPTRELASVIGVAHSALVVGLDAGDSRPSIPADFEADEALSDKVLPLVVSAHWKAPTSSGSTGTPKLIVSTEAAIVDTLVPLMPLVKMKQGGVKLTTTPLSHNMGVLFTTGPLVTGGTVVIAPRFDAEATLALIERYEVDWVCLVPTMLHRIAKLPDRTRERADLSSLIAVVTAGASAPMWLKSFYVDWIGADRLVEFYSTTESQIATIANGSDWIAHPGTVGRVVIGEIEVRGESGEVLPEGQVGELWMRRGRDQPPPYVYLGATPQRDGSGWETVGDMGRLEGGWLYLADRKVDMALIGGSNVYPAEVEGALEEHPLVLSCCVFGVPDEEYGNVLHAVVQTSDEVSDEALTSYLRARLVPYKIPRTFGRSMTPLRDEAGKVRRAKMRDQLLAARAQVVEPTNA